MGQIPADQKAKAEKNTTPEQREVVEESSYDYSNGNRNHGDNSGDEGGAEKGGPDADKAAAKQPPEATR